VAVRSSAVRGSPSAVRWVIGRASSFAKASADESADESCWCSRTGGNRRGRPFYFVAPALRRCTSYGFRSLAMPAQSQRESQSHVGACSEYDTGESWLDLTGPNKGSDGFVYNRQISTL
jgi:hypothetical protein